MSHFFGNLALTKQLAAHMAAQLPGLQEEDLLEVGGRVGLWQEGRRLAVVITQPPVACNGTRAAGKLLCCISLLR